MIKNTFNFLPPWNTSKGDNVDTDKVNQVNLALKSIFSNSLQLRSGTYTGNASSGRSQSQNISLDISPIYVIIGKYNTVTDFQLSSPVGTISGDLSMAFKVNEGSTFIPGTGYVNNGITSFNVDGFTVGGNLSLNNLGTTYFYIAVG